MDYLNKDSLKNDGIHKMLDSDKMSCSAKKLRDIYNLKKDAPLFMKEFGFYSTERWISEGHIKSESELKSLCGFDDEGHFALGNLGWCEAEFIPTFKEELVREEGNKEVVVDFAGRHVMYFKGRRQGFMPEYVDHPVKNIETWNENCKWRLNPQEPIRMQNIKSRLKEAIEAAKKGLMIQGGFVGGYMYLRSLMGPEQIMYLLYDDPKLIHSCMQTWFDLTDKVLSEFQKQVTIDELFFAEDISYKSGSLISPDMIRNILFPYYQQVIKNVKKRQIDKTRHLYIQLDTDGNCVPLIPIYAELGFDAMSPFEVASDCDVVDIGKKYPNLIMSGGIDKRILATTPYEIDKMIDTIIPVMKKRGGYTPTCDHGVPEEVSFENYIHFRKRLLEYSN